MPDQAKARQYTKSGGLGLGGGIQKVLDALALVTTPVPGAGDAIGIGADLYRYATDPESRTWGNAALTAAGALPFVPAMSAVKAATNAAEPVLDMSQEARMARAAEQGFDIDAYKGAYPYDYNTGPVYAMKNGEWQQVDRIGAEPEQLTHFDTPDKPYSGFYAQDKEVANNFAEALGHGAVFPVKMKFDNPVVIDGKGKHAAAFQFESVAREQDSISDFKRYQAALDDSSVDGVIIKNTKDEGTVYIPKTPQQVRSVHAAFDPAKRDSADLLASVAAGGIGLGLSPALYRQIYGEGEE